MVIALLHKIIVTFSPSTGREIPDSTVAGGISTALNSSHTEEALYSMLNHPALRMPSYMELYAIFRMFIMFLLHYIMRGEHEKYCSPYWFGTSVL